MKLSTPLSNRSLFLTLTLPIILSFVASTIWISAHSRPEATPSANSQAREAYGRIPLSFESNQGQTESSVDFLARGAGYTLFLKPSRPCSSLTAKAEVPRPRSNPRANARSRHTSEDDNPPRVLRMKLLGADEAALARSAEQLPGKVNYFTGDDPSKWRADVPTYARVRYGQVYPGVDVVYYGNQRQLEYDFVVAPGSRPSRNQTSSSKARTKLKWTPRAICY